MTFSEESIKKLAGLVKERLSEKRFLHTLGVLRAATKLCEYCAPELTGEAAVAALLHDITKECTLEEQYELIKEGRLSIDAEDFESPAVLHSYTASFVIKRDFEDFATARVLSAVYNHTLGAPDMTVLDEIIFLADFIEDTRIYKSSVSLRNFVWENFKKEDRSFNIRLLHKACVYAIDATVSNLTENKKAVNVKNILTKNALLSKI